MRATLSAALMLMAPQLQMASQTGKRAERHPPRQLLERCSVGVRPHVDEACSQNNTRAKGLQHEEDRAPIRSIWAHFACA